jgi:kinetochore protein Mis12/MTW1
MASSKQIETALLTEHLRYTPLTLLDDIINTVNEVTNKAVDAAEDSLLRAGPTNLGFPAVAKTNPETQIDGDGFYPEARAEIDEGVHKLETLLEANIDKNFDKLEIYVLRNVLTAPAELIPWIRLSHYDVNTRDFTAFMTVMLIFFTPEHISPHHEYSILVADP